MAAKAGALHGEFIDSTPFQFHETNRAVDVFGEMLKKAGYDYYGNERLYSGILGEELRADIFFGVVYYQRLRHMVGDKFQVRSTGPVNRLTHQPIKGRKVGGGIRFGEMERDSLLAHGATYLLHDRLTKCSDGCVTQICTRCGSILSPALAPPTIMSMDQGAGPVVMTTKFSSGDSNKNGTMVCRACGPSAKVENIRLPYVYRYLNVELAAMNINMCLQVS